jgi:hypothetical protein
LEQLSKYLLDPEGTGVFLFRVTIGAEDLREFMEAVNKLCEPPTPTAEGGWLWDKPKTKVGENEGPLYDSEFFPMVPDAINHMVRFVPIEKARGYLPTVMMLEDTAFGRLLTSRRASNIEALLEQDRRYELMLRHSFAGNRLNLGPDISLPSMRDCIHISESGDSRTRVLEIASLSEETGERYLDYLVHVPGLGRNLVVVRSGWKHTSQVVRALLPPALMTWMKGEEAVSCVPEYVMNFLMAASEYYGREEWRTSIVMSSIVSETVVAEYYEDVFRRQAGDLTLGQLLNNVEQQFKKSGKTCGTKGVRAMPKDLLKDGGETNRLRKESVHRGTSALLQSDALQALANSSRFVVWYYV